jgi:hypothetical protein
MARFGYPAMEFDDSSSGGEEEREQDEREYNMTDY